jgi:TetR/AcrR family transcriptional regulator, regulator of cefoperazone and chloramphenicol sensitivity
VGIAGDPASPERARRTTRKGRQESSPAGAEQGDGDGGAAAGAVARRPNGDSRSRKRVVNAAIQTILEQGLYRASSNAIAERAGLTWGVIQYYFGSREALMLAVLEEGARRLSESVQTANVTGETVTERVEQYMDILSTYYGSPDYLAFTEVLLNLSHDPRTSQQTLDTLARINEATNPSLHSLQAQVLVGTGIQEKAMLYLLFNGLRGLALSQVMLGAVPLNLSDQMQTFPTQRKYLAEAIGLLIERHSEYDR